MADQREHDLNRRTLLAGGGAMLIPLLSCSGGASLAAPHDLLVSADGIARMGAKAYRCAVGRSGVRREKREGDGATPVGAWMLRQVFYRADRVRLPALQLQTRALARGDGWCDAPSDANYNTHVQLPYPASAEALWRDDSLYDVIAVLGYNDAPVVPGLGSAIFLHVASSAYGPTAGCVALALQDLIEFLAQATPATRVVVAAG